jgi:steroid delta-isomerase-like uncharacterized protein
MSVQVSETVKRYVDVLLERGDYGQMLADDAEFSIAGTDQQAHGRDGVVETIRFFHEIAFDAQPEFGDVIAGERGAAVEAVFAGTHTGEFAGVPASGNAVRVPYSAFYDVDGDHITAIRLYVSLEQLIGQISAKATSGSVSA